MKATVNAASRCLLKLSEKMCAGPMESARTIQAQGKRQRNFDAVIAKAGLLTLVMQRNLYHKIHPPTGMNMTYESWRISYQSSEQAARSAYAEITTLTAKLAELTRQRDEYKKDAERIEWLHKSFFDRKWNGVVGSGESYIWSIYGDYRHVLQQLKRHDFRDAIDAAIRAMKEE